MSEPLAPGVYPASEGDAHAPLTRVLYAQMPARYGDARVGVLPNGTEVMVIRPGLSRADRKAAVKAEFARMGYWRGAAVIMYGADLARRAVQYPSRGMHAAGQLPHMIAEHGVPPAVISVSATLAAVGVIAGTVDVSGIIAHPHASGPLAGSPAWHRQHPVHVHLQAAPLAYLGVYEPTSPNSYAGIDTFARDAGRRPNLALYYSGLFEPFRVEFADEAAEAGAIPVVQLNPETAAMPGPTVGEMPGNGSATVSVSLAAIAEGAYDDYFTSYADSVAAYGRAVILSFAPEANGTWYPWSSQPPREYVAAWRHIVGLFRKQGADNVTWMWTVNRVSGGARGDLSQWWPGDAYVNWVGIDGYYRHPRDLWDYVFAPTIGDVRQFTSKPVIISETAIGQRGTRPGQLADMYTHIREDADLGLIWFDEDKDGLDFRLEGDEPAIRVFHQETQAWRLEHQQRRHTS